MYAGAEWGNGDVYISISFYLTGLFDHFPLVNEFVLMSGGTNVVFMPNHFIVTKWTLVLMCKASALRCYQQRRFIDAHFSHYKEMPLWRHFRHWLQWTLLNDTFQCNQWWKFRQNDISFSVNLQSFIDISPLYNEVRQ